MKNSPKIIDQAFVLAAGFGKRMLPITNKIPKPLVEVKGVSLLKRIFDDLKAAGIKKIIINCHHLADQIKSFAESYDSSVEIIVSYEKEILETGGGIAKALHNFQEKPFFVVNGDVLMPHNNGNNAYKNLSDQWSNEMNGLLLLNAIKNSIGYEGKGDFNIDNASKIIDNAEVKPYVFAGISLVHPRIFNSHEVKYLKFVDVMRDMNFDKIYGLKNSLPWIHAGTPESITQAEDYMNKNGFI